MGEFNRVEFKPAISGPDAPVKGERPTVQSLQQQQQQQPAQQPAQQPSQSTPQDKPAERPAWCPEKFWKNGVVDQEGLAKSYAELEKGKPKTDLKVEQQPSGEQTPKADQPKADEQKAGEQPEMVIPGLKQEQTTKYWGELSEGGKLSDGSYDELAKAGYPKHVVDAYIRGIQAEQSQAQTQVTELKSLAGGDEGYAAMADWMSTNLDPAELEEYNQAVSSGNKIVTKHAVQSMHARYTQAVGGEPPKLLGGQGNRGPVGDVFRSQQELTEAMRDKRYKKDAAYRKDVEEKLARSKW